MSNSYEDIARRMKSALQSDASKMEGSWTADNIQAVANELARIYAQDVEPMLDKAFVSTATGEALTLACADYGITRNPATSAEVNLTITGASGIYEPIRVAADDVIFETAAFNISAGSAVVRAVCLTAGSHGNVPAGSINKVLSEDRGINSVINTKAAAGGYDTESDISLAARTLEHIRQPSTSGNIADYKKWALEVTGVENVRIFPLARGAGTVDVVIIGDGNTMAPEILVDSVSDYIDQMRPIGADVLIMSANAMTIEVEAHIIAMEDYTADEIAYQLQEALKNYAASITFKSSVVSYLKIADIIFSCAGVADIMSYTVNGSRISVALDDRQFPIAVTPTITLA